MKKPVPKAGRMTIPALLCCLTMQPVMAAVPTTYASLRGAVANAQPAATVTGRVVDEKGAGVPGVNVLVKGTSTGTQTDADGRYSFTVPDDATLVFSFVGYTSQEVAVGGRSTVDVTLAPDSKALSEIVVVGYLTQDRQNVTSAVASVDTREVNKVPVPTLSQAIQGRVAGVQVLGSGAPGAVPNIVIRGVGSLNAGSAPLYVIDGLWTDNIRDLSPTDIESAVVLKDASSTAVYGSRGANGVILITTKKGQAGEPKISVNGYMGVESIYKRYNLTNHSEWADRATTAYINAGLDPTTEGMAGAVKNGPRYTNAIDTDWQKEFFQNGRVQDYNVTLSGGTTGEKSAGNFLISGGYFNQEGIVKGPKFERYSARVNSGLRRGRLKVGESLLVTHINTTLLNGAPFIDVLTELPGIPVYDPTHVGGFGYGSNGYLFNYSSNPVGEQQILSRTQKNNRLQGSANAEFTFTNWLSYRLNLGLEVHDYNDKDFRQNGFTRLGEASNPNNTFLFENRGTATTTLIENTLNFNRRFGDHGVNALVGYSEQTANVNNATARATLFLSQPQYFPVLSGSTASSGTVGGGLDEYNKRSYFTQLNYDFKNRYLLTGSFRRDGSSRFDSNNKYGNFGAGSVGWRISEEDFFKNALPMVNSLKLRASYGVNGNDNLPGSYLYQATVNQNVTYPLGPGLQNFTNGAIQIGLESRNIRWESRYTSNIGLDLALLSNRLTLSADYYTSTTKDALVNPQLPAYLGTIIAIQPYTNLGEIRNKGFEFALGYHENRNAFTYGADLNLTTLKNEVLALSELQPVIPGPFGVTRTQVGQPIGRLYLVEMLGIFQNQDEINNYKSADGRVIQPLAKPGDVKYKDANGDGRIGADTDREFVGNPFPTLQFGLNLTAGYKGFDLSLFLQGVTGNTIYNNTRAAIDQLNGVNNYRRDLSPWTPENPSTTTPRLVQGGGGEAVNNNNAITTRWIEKGDYLRLRNVQLGYTFPKTLAGLVPGLGSVRVYVTGRNVFTLTKYLGYDPETPGQGVYGPGIDSSSYPNVRAFTGGVQVNF